jgi:DNA primase
MRIDALKLIEFKVKESGSSGWVKSNIRNEIPGSFLVSGESNCKACG